MDRSVELQWREIVAHLDAAPVEPHDDAIARWAVVLGVLGLLPLAAPDLLLAALPPAAAALLLGAVGLHRATAFGRGRTLAGIAVLLGAAPVLTVLLIGTLALTLLAP